MHFSFFVTSWRWCWCCCCCCYCRNCCCRCRCCCCCCCCCYCRNCCCCWRCCCCCCSWMFWKTGFSNWNADISSYVRSFIDKQRHLSHRSVGPNWKIEPANYLEEVATVGKSAAKKSCQFKEICLAFFTCQFTAIFQKKIFKALQFFDDKSLLLKTRLQLRNNYVAAACLGSIVPLVKADLFK